MTRRQYTVVVVPLLAQSIALYPVICFPTSVSFRLRLFRRLVMVDAGVPEESLIAVSPEVILCSYVLIAVLWPVLQWLKVLPVGPMLSPQLIGICTGDQQARNNGIDGQLAPKITRGSCVVLHCFSLAIECIILGSFEGILSAGESSLEGGTRAAELSTEA